MAEVSISCEETNSKGSYVAKVDGFAGEGVLTDRGIDVRPHPHINLTTVTYLLEGEIRHRDSLGTDVAIRPGAVNWMKAGRGIVHSERTSQEKRETGQRLFGVQTWVALPEAVEESDPALGRLQRQLNRIGWIGPAAV